MLGDDVVLVHCSRAWTPDDVALSSRGTGTSVVHCPTGPGEDGQRRDAGAPPAQRRHQRLARHRRRGRQQRRRPDARPQVGRLPAEAAARRSRPSTTCEEVSRWRRCGGARALGLGPSRLDRAGQARRPDRGPHRRPGLDARSQPGRRTSSTRPPAPTSTRSMVDGDMLMEGRQMTHARRGAHPGRGAQRRRGAVRAHGRAHRGPLAGVLTCAARAPSRAGAPAVPAGALPAVPDERARSRRSTRSRPRSCSSWSRRSSSTGRTCRSRPT